MKRYIALICSALFVFCFGGAFGSLALNALPKNILEKTPQAVLEKVPKVVLVENQAQLIAAISENKDSVIKLSGDIVCEQPLVFSGEFEFKLDLAGKNLILGKEALPVMTGADIQIPVPEQTFGLVINGGASLTIMDSGIILSDEGALNNLLKINDSFLIDGGSFTLNNGKMEATEIVLSRETASSFFNMNEGKLFVKSFIAKESLIEKEITDETAEPLKSEINFAGSQVVFSSEKAVPDISGCSVIITGGSVKGGGILGELISDIAPINALGDPVYLKLIAGTPLTTQNYVLKSIKDSVIYPLFFDEDGICGAYLTIDEIEILESMYSSNNQNNDPNFSGKADYLNRPLFGLSTTGPSTTTTDPTTTPRTTSTNLTTPTNTTPTNVTTTSRSIRTSRTTKYSGGAKTGDSGSYTAMFIIMILSAATIFTLMYKYGRQKPVTEGFSAIEADDDELVDEIKTDE